MKKLTNKLIPILFYILLFWTPLILFPKTSELFEFNKISFIYVLTILILGSWLGRMILVKKIIFRRTILDIPLLLFLGSQILSLLTSIDRHTSLFGYYGRFNGGLISSIAYALLYWAFVSNMNPKKTINALYFLFASAFLVSIYGVLQHFGVDKNLWVQDVQNRVFSTLGQPNWLATFMLALIPITWAFFLKTKRIMFLALQLLFLIVLLWTKSRSGILGFLTADGLFWGFTILKGNIKKFAKLFLILNLSLLFISSIIGTPWTPSIENYLKSKLPEKEISQELSEPGGTESGEIRKLVWKGAIEVWKHYPLTGSGVETFAFSFYEFRPKEHNLVSEWDFLFNKAHNEYLNFAATTGTVGLVAYFTLIFFSILQISRSRVPNSFSFAFISGFSGILVANFFGFSTTVPSLLFFLLPAFAFSLKAPEIKFKIQREKLTLVQLFLFMLVILSIFYGFYSVSRFWFSDFLYTKGGKESAEGQFDNAKRDLSLAIQLNPKEPLYLNELAQTISFEAISSENLGEVSLAHTLAKEAVEKTQQAVQMSPRNLTLLRNREGLLIRLSSFDPIYLHEAKNTMLLEAKYSPTDAKLFYNLGLSYARIGQISDAISTLEKTIELKDNYRDARFALALMYKNEGRFEESIRELNYIIENISPDDALAEQELHELTGK